MRVVPRMGDEYRYLMSVSETLEAGKWIAIIDDKIVAKGESGKDVFNAAKEKYPGREPLIMMVPDNSVMLL